MPASIRLASAKACQCSSRGPRGSKRNPPHRRGASGPRPRRRRRAIANFLDPGEALFAVALQLQGAAPGEERQLGLFPVQAGRLPVVPGTEYLQRVQWVDLERRRHQHRTIERLRLADGALEGAAQGVQALAQGCQPAHAAPRVWRQYLICSAMYQWMICANSPSTKGASSPFSSAQRRAREHRGDPLGRRNRRLAGLEARRRLDVVHAAAEGLDDIQVDPVDGLADVRQAGAVFGSFHHATSRERASGCARRRSRCSITASRLSLR